MRQSKHETVYRLNCKIKVRVEGRANKEMHPPAISRTQQVSLPQWRGHDLAVQPYVVSQLLLVGAEKLVYLQGSGAHTEHALGVPVATSFRNERFPPPPP